MVFGAHERRGAVVMGLTSSSLVCEWCCDNRKNKAGERFNGPDTPTVDQRALRKDANGRCNEYFVCYLLIGRQRSGRRPERCRRGGVAWCEVRERGRGERVLRR